MTSDILRRQKSQIYMLGLIDLMTRDISPNHILIEINNTGPGNAVNEMSDVNQSKSHWRYLNF